MLLVFLVIFLIYYFLWGIFIHLLLYLKYFWLNKSIFRSHIALSSTACANCLLTNLLLLISNFSTSLPVDSALQKLSHHLESCKSPSRTWCLTGRNVRRLRRHASPFLIPPPSAFIVLRCHHIVLLDAVWWRIVCYAVDNHVLFSHVQGSWPATLLSSSILRVKSFSLVSTTERHFVELTKVQLHYILLPIWSTHHNDWRPCISTLSYHPLTPFASPAPRPLARSHCLLPYIPYS